MAHINRSQSWGAPHCDATPPTFNIPYPKALWSNSTPTAPSHRKSHTGTNNTTITNSLPASEPARVPYLTIGRCTLAVHDRHVGGRISSKGMMIVSSSREPALVFPNNALNPVSVWVRYPFYHPVGRKRGRRHTEIAGSLETKSKEETS